MKIITLAKVKELLGITDSSQDADITAKIPYVDSVVKQMTHNRYNMVIVGDVTLDSEYVPVSSIIQTYGRYIYNSREYDYRSGINNNQYYDDITEYIEIGQLIEGTGIPAETYVEDIVTTGTSQTIGGTEYNVPFIKMSAVATESTSSAQLTLGITIGLQPTIAKGIAWLIDQTNENIPSRALAARSVGSASWSFADQQIDNRYGMPSWFVKAFPVYIRGH